MDTNPKHQQTNSSGKIPVINNENFYYYLINRTLAFKILAVNPTLKKITKRGKNNKPKAEPASGSFTFYNEHIVIKSWQLYLHMRYSEQFKNWTQFTKLPVFRDWSSTYVSCALKRELQTLLPTEPMIYCNSYTQIKHIMICVSCSHIIFKEAAYYNQPNIQSVHLVPSFSTSVSRHYARVLTTKAY